MNQGKIFKQITKFYYYYYFSTHDIKNLKLLKSSLSKEKSVPKNSEASEAVSSSNKECANSPLHEESSKKKG